MSNSVYQINKGINKPVEFKGLKAQYIWYLGGGMIGLFILFAILYFIGLNTFICAGLVLTAGGFWFAYVYRLSHKYGQFGMMKATAARLVPHRIKSRSRKVFTQLRKKHSNDG